MNIQEQIKGLEFFVDHFGAFSEEGQIACGAIDTMEQLYAVYLAAETVMDLGMDAAGDDWDVLESALVAAAKEQE